MRLTHLQLTNFRTYKKFSEEFERVVILVGPNGIGKTNILEAIYLLSVLKSYRAATDQEVIRFGEEFAKIVGIIENREQRAENSQAKPIRSTDRRSRFADHDELEIIIHQGEKKAKKNGAAKPLSQLIGTLKAVLFSPEQLDIVTGPPRRRRRFLDSLLSQIDPRYTQSLLEYQKALGNRNALLFSIKTRGASATELFFWDKRLIESGEKITERRGDLVDYFNAQLAPKYQLLSQGKESLTINPHFQRLSHDLLQEYLSRDIELAATTVGPHRDNFTLALGNRELGPFGSRGEWRSALFALKLVEVEFLRRESSAEPILLLDDVFSELDGGRRQRLFETFQADQLFITTTDTAQVNESVRKSAQVLEVANYAAT